MGNSFRDLSSDLGANLDQVASKSRWKVGLVVDTYHMGVYIVVAIRAAKPILATAGTVIELDSMASIRAIDAQVTARYTEYRSTKPNDIFIYYYRGTCIDAPLVRSDIYEIVLKKIRDISCRRAHTQPRSPSINTHAVDRGTVQMRSAEPSSQIQPQAHGRYYHSPSDDCTSYPDDNIAEL